MCTAISFKTECHYFGRNLDIDIGFGESAVFTPRNYPFTFKNGKKMLCHYSIFGTATIIDGTPLYYEAVNEKGLCVAALNFPENAFYADGLPTNAFLAPYEVMPFVLGEFNDATEAVKKLKKYIIANIPFKKELPVTPLHWLISDKNRSFTIEPLASGIKIFENPVGVLTNEPPFDYHMYNLRGYLNLTSDYPQSRFSKALSLKPFSFGMGAMGLPGDPSSASRFVKATFLKFNSECENREQQSVNQFFHILSGVEQQRGITRLPNGNFEYTLYSSCFNTDTLSAYYATYEHRGIRKIDFAKEDKGGKALCIYPLEC